MSRTFKDKHVKCYIGDFDITVSHTFPRKVHRNLVDRDKQPRFANPCWWNHMTTTKRKRANFRNLRASIFTTKDLEELDITTFWNKPKEYYW